MKKAVIITNVPSPYRVDFFYYLQTHFGEQYEFSIIYYVNDSMNRQWKTDESRILNSHFLSSKTLRFKKRFDDYFITFPVGVGKKLSELKPDVVIAMEYSPTIILAMNWCRFHKVPYVSWSDGTIFSERNIGKGQKISRKYIVKRATEFIGSSNATIANQIKMGANPERCHLSLLTVDLDKYILEGEKSYSNRIICVGSLIERKGVDLLLNALALTKEDIVLDIVGDGIERENLMALSEKLGIENKVNFLGFLDGETLRKKYHEAGAFVLPTREDCFGLVLIEAMCAKLPIISSKYSDGAYETIEEGRNGYIIDPYDSKAFAEALDKMFLDKKKLSDMGNESFAMKDKFYFENVAKGYIEAVDAALGR